MSLKAFFIGMNYMISRKMSLDINIFEKNNWYV